MTVSNVTKIKVFKTEKRTFKGMSLDERIQVKEFFEATTRELDQLSHLAARESSIQLVLQDWLYFSEWRRVRVTFQGHVFKSGVRARWQGDLLEKGGRDRS